MASVMSAIKDGRFPIVLDKERHLLFSLNAIDEMQDKFGGFDRLDTVLSGKDSIKNLRWLLTLFTPKANAVTLSRSVPTLVSFWV